MLWHRLLRRDKAEESTKYIKVSSYIYKKNIYINRRSEIKAWDKFREVAFRDVKTELRTVGDKDWKVDYWGQKISSIKRIKHAYGR